MQLLTMTHIFLMFIAAIIVKVFTQFYRYEHNLSGEVWIQNYEYSFRLVTTFTSLVPRGNIGKMVPDSKKQRRISDLSTLCRVVQKTHKVKLNFVRKCKF